MKYYIIAGEASGDLHGANLMKALYLQDPKAEIRFWGGDLMQAVGGTLVKHYKELAFMGFIEVLFNLKTILNNITIAKKDILEFQPDVIVFWALLKSDKEFMARGVILAVIVLTIITLFV